MKRKRNAPKRVEVAGAGAEALEPQEGWRLPSGESLAEFALHAGFVGSLMMASRAVAAAEEEPAAPAETELEELRARLACKRNRRLGDGR